MTTNANNSTQNIIHWHILGAGAIGCLWASYWHDDAIETTLITRSPEDQRIFSRTKGNKTQQYTINTLANDQIDSAISHLLICTKAQQSLEAYKRLKSNLRKDAIIVVLQNGMTAKELSTQHQQQLFAATTTDGAYFKSHGKLIHAGTGTTFLGSLTLPIRASKELCQILPSKLTIEPCDNIEQRLWQKLAINCAINALGVKYQCKNGEIITSNDRAAELRALCQEIQQIASALHLGDWFNDLYDHVISVITKTSENVNSTQQDIINGKTTEIGELNGYLCRQAASQSIPAPLNRALYELVIQKSSLQ